MRIEIERLRKLLHEELAKEDIDSKKVLSLSRKLDKVIVAYYASRKGAGQGPR